MATIQVNVEGGEDPAVSNKAEAPITSTPTRKKPVYESDGVYVHLSKSQAEEVQVPGRLCLYEQDDLAYVQWKPLHQAVSYRTDDDQDWAVIGLNEDPVSASNHDDYEQYSMLFALSDVVSVRCIRSSMTWKRLVFHLRDGEQLTPLYFHGASQASFWACLNRYFVLAKTPGDSSLYEVSNPMDSTDALNKSLQGLQFSSEEASGLISNWFHGTEETLLGGFSKVTRFVRQLGSSETGSAAAVLKGVHKTSGSSTASSKVSDSTGSKHPVASPYSDFEMVAEQDKVITLKLPAYEGQLSRECPINLSEWESMLDSEGRVLKLKRFRERLFKGGLDPSLRCHVWKFLLGYFDYGSTEAERAAIRESKRHEYNTMLRQWQTLLPSQMRRFSVFRERKHLVAKDVMRTDRTHPKFRDSESSYLKRLSDILITYCFYNFDLGYVQGMSDLCAPILVVMEDEVDTFWCFAGLMDMVESNFSEDQLGMRGQLNKLENLLYVADPKLMEYLAMHDSDNLYFCFRWLLVQFKRELNFDDTMRLWEVLWSRHFSNHFHLFLCAAILTQEKLNIVNEQMDFNEIIKYINELSGRIHLDLMLVEAERLCHQLAACPELPSDLADLVHKPAVSEQLEMSFEGDGMLCTPDISSVMVSERLVRS